MTKKPRLTLVTDEFKGSAAGASFIRLPYASGDFISISREVIAKVLPHLVAASKEASQDFSYAVAMEEEPHTEEGAQLWQVIGYKNGLPGFDGEVEKIVTYCGYGLAGGAPVSRWANITDKLSPEEWDSMQKAAHGTSQGAPKPQEP